MTDSTQFWRSSRVSGQVLQLVSTGLRESHADQAKDHLEAIARLQAEYDRIQARLHAKYVDKLDGRIDTFFFDKLSGDWRKEQDKCLREIGRHQSADQSYLEEGVGLLEMARNAQRLFAKQEPMEKRRLLNFVVSNWTLSGGELRAMLRQQFDLLAETTSRVAQASKDQGRNLADRSGWLGN